MAINRASISKELLPGLNAVFGMEYGEVDNEHDVLFDVENSDRAFEEEVLFTGFGSAPTKGEGAAVSYDDAQESYTARYTAETVALAFAITEEAMEDNLMIPLLNFVQEVLLEQWQIQNRLKLQIYSTMVSLILLVMVLLSSLLHTQLLLTAIRAT